MLICLLDLYSSDSYTVTFRTVELCLCRGKSQNCPSVSYEVPVPLYKRAFGFLNSWAWRASGKWGPNVCSHISFFCLKSIGNPVCNRHHVVSFSSYSVSNWYATAGNGLSAMKWCLTGNSCAGNDSLLQQPVQKRFGQFTANYKWKSYLFCVFSSSLLALEVLSSIQNATF